MTPRRLLSGPTLATGKSSTVGAALTGSRVILALARQERGSGSKAHTPPNEQFNYILQGTMTGEVDGETLFASAGSLWHTPAGAVHTGLACPEEDLVFVAVKDTHSGLVGPPVDGRYDGPAYLPGFGTRAAEPRKSTAQLMAQAGRDARGEKRRYVYDFGPLAEGGARAASAQVAPFASGGASGWVVSGEMLHVALLRFAPGAELAARAHAAEQFSFVAEGELAAELEGGRLHVGRGCALHVPAGLDHALAVPSGALVLCVQEARYPFSA